MLFLLLAIASSAMVSIFMRLGTRNRPQSMSMLAANYLACSVVAACFMTPGALLPAGGLGSTLPLSLLTGALYLLGFVLLQLNVRKNGVVLSAIFIKLGLLVPMVLSLALFGERPTGPQALGFFLAVGSIVLMNLEKGSSPMEFRLGLVLLLLAGGSCDAMSKVFEQIGNPAHGEQFLFYGFFTAFALCLVLVLLRRERPGWRELAYGVLIGIPNYFSARFLLKALDTLPAVVAYPTYSVATIVAVTIVGLLCFRERLGKRQWIAMCGILAALWLLNLG